MRLSEAIDGWFRRRGEGQRQHTSNAPLWAILLATSLICASAFADELGTALYEISRQQSGATTDVPALEAECLALLATYTSDEDQVRIYDTLIDICTGSGLKWKSIQAKYAEKALELPLDVTMRTKMLMCKAAGIMGSHAGARGQERVEPRRLAARSFLEALKLCLGENLPEEPPPLPGKETRREVLKRLREESIFLEGMIYARNACESTLVDMYRLPPVAPEELRQLALEILGDPAWADRLAGQVEERIAGLRSKMEKVGVESKMIDTLLKEGKSIREQQLERKEEASAAQQHRAPETPSTGARRQARPAAEKAGRWPWIAAAAVLVLSVVTVLSVRIRARR